MPEIHRQQLSITDLQQENQRLHLLQRIAMLASEQRERPALLHSVLDEIQQFFSADGGGIYQFDHDDSPRYLTANLGIPLGLVRELQKIPVGKGLTEQVIRGNAPYSWIDLRCEAQLFCKAVLDEGWRSLLSLPLCTPERIIGTLFIFQRIPRQFSPQDIELLEKVCRILAGAIASTELVDKLGWQQQMTEAGQRELERSRMQLRAHLERLEESNRALEQTNRAKTRFLGLASHELRTPLTCVLSATELLQLKMPDVPEEIRDLLMTLEESGLRLQTLIEDLLEVARIESRHLYLANEPLDMKQMLTDLHLEYAMKAKGLEFSFSLDGVSEPLSIHGDAHHLRRALTRILDNACKYTPAGGSISIRVSHCAKPELNERRPQLDKFSTDFFTSAMADSYLKVQIVDTGTGIDEDERLLIFDKFHSTTPLKHHSSNPKSGQAGGAGLGLPLAKGIIEGHGGMIWIESPDSGSNGSIFNVLLPLHVPDADQGSGL